MMYIIDISCISPQNTFDSKPFGNSVIHHKGNRYYALEPAYKNIIPSAQLRRMGKTSRLGIGAGTPLIKRNQNLDGIIIGTANGGLEDCVKFLDQIIRYDEGTLTPTNFVQSTANTVSGTLALITQNTGYNTTHVSAGLAFESALLDALMFIEEGAGNKYLIGNAEEISDYNYNIDSHRGLFKKEPVPSQNLLKSNTIGSVSGEGAAMFVVSNNSENSLATVLDVSMIQTEVFDEVEFALKAFLLKNNLTYEAIDTIILGFNGDFVKDRFYYKFLEKHFKTQLVLSFKNLVGEYGSVSGFALWLSVQQTSVPHEAIFRKVSTPTTGNILIYNHYNGLNHGFILVKK